MMMRKPVQVQDYEKDEDKDKDWEEKIGAYVSGAALGE